MRFIIAAIVGLAAVAQAALTDTSYTTEVLTAYTTYCPSATQLTHNGVTYTVTEPATLTITNCPCTVTKAVYSSIVTSSTCSTTSSAAYKGNTSVYGGSIPSVPIPSIYKANSTMPMYTLPTTGSPVTTSASSVSTGPIASYTGAANKVSFGVAGLLAAAGLVVAL